MVAVKTDAQVLYMADNGLPVTSADVRRLVAEKKALREALEWYGENARLARLIHSDGDKGRFALAEDGGERARAALRSEQGESDE